MDLNWKELNYTLVTVTPEIADEWLKRNTRNRDQRSINVTKTSRDMINGRYQLTHQGIAFDYNGVLIDGQHRLESIMKSGAFVRMWVATGLDPAIMEVIDTGSMRKPKDSLALCGLGRGCGSVSPNTEAGMWSRMMHGISNHKGGETRTEIVAFAKTYADAGTWTIGEFGAHPRCQAHIAPVLAAVARAYYHLDHGRLGDFVRVLCTGIPEESHEDVTALHYRNALMMKRFRGNSNASSQIYGKTCRAIDYFCARVEINRFVTPDEEPFPLPDRPSAEAVAGSDRVARNLRRPVQGELGSYPLAAGPRKH